MSLVSRLHNPELEIVRLEPRQEATHMLVGLMEAMWLTPWFAIILPQARQLPPYGLLAYVAGNLLLALGLVRVLDARGLYENLRQFAFLCGLVAMILLSTGTLLTPLPQEAAVQVISENVAPAQSITLPPILTVVILLALIWWRGLRLAIVMPTPLRVAFAMRLGILFYLGAALFPFAQPALIASLPPFFFFGLLGNSLARAISLRETGGLGVTFGSRWAGFMTLAAGVITLVGFGIAAALSGLDPEAMSRLVQPVLSALLYVFAVLMTPILLIVQAIVEALINALLSGPIGNMIEISPLTNTIAQGPPQANALEEALQKLRQFFDLFGGLGTCITVAIVLVIVAVIILTLRRRQRAVLVEGEIREDLDGGDALNGLRSLFRRGLDAMNQALRTVGQFGLGRDLFAALTVRRAYAQMVRLAAKRGYPRAVSQTPYEFRAVLREAFPAAQEEVSTLTEAYVRVHYGEVPESADALRAVTEALERFRTLSSTPQ
jgi:hypothetical protein